MRTLKLKKKQIDFKEFNLQFASEKHYDTFIDEDVLIEIEGQLPLLYKKLDIDTRDLRHACLNVKYSGNYRNGGMKMRAAHIGYKTRNRIKDDFCNLTATAYKFPSLHDIFVSYAKLLAAEYQECFPDLFRQHMKSLKTEGKPISNDYIISGTPFTSGIINKNMPLRYHLDKGNIPGNMSAMITLKQDTAGGYLSIPELGIGLKIANNSLLMFDGQSLIHGVTPIHLQNQFAYRYSIVFYSLQQMWNANLLKLN
jgi:hypothetical protein